MVLAVKLDEAAWPLEPVVAEVVAVLFAKVPEATADGFIGTDEASVVERAGLPVAVVHGSQVNLKITQPGDLELAEFYLRQRGR